MTRRELAFKIIKQFHDAYPDVVFSLKLYQDKVEITYDPRRESRKEDFQIQFDNFRFGETPKVCDKGQIKITQITDCTV